MSALEEYQQRLADITRESNFALWNGVLTLDGIIASVFSAVAIFEESVKPVAFLIVGASVISAALIILNFQSTRDQFRVMGASVSKFDAMSPEVRQEQLRDSVRKHHWCNRREQFSWVLLTVQALLIFALLYLKRA